LALDPIPSSAFNFVSHVERAYAGLMQTGAARLSAAAGKEPDLGGKLLYAGELDDAGRELVVAGNIAGAASLAASADLSAQKQAIRDGVVDFLVTSLDEALRILKNEIRKHETVAVCVGAAPDAVEREMLERGGLPVPSFTGRERSLSSLAVLRVVRSALSGALRQRRRSGCPSWTRLSSIALNRMHTLPGAGSAWPRATWEGWRRACA
jgi:hypothetical protein